MKTRNNQLKDIYSTMNTFSVIQVGGRDHVIRPYLRNGNAYPEPNYRGTGQALVGVIEKGKALSDFKDKYLTMKVRSMEFIS